MVDMLREQRVDWQHIGNIIDSQISAQRDLHNDYTTQVAHLKEFAVRGFAQNSEKARTGLDDLLSKMQLSESKLQENEGMGTDTSHLAEKLREIASYHQKSEGPQIEEPQGPSSLAVARQTPLSERDRFSFSATLVGQSNGEVEHLVARAKMDTGCEDNWISEEILTRACLLQLVVPVETDHTFLGFGGAAFEPLGRVEITWFGVNKAKSWKNLFFVHRDGPFDMVLGSTWITEDSLMMLSQPALALRMTDFTKGKYLLAPLSLIATHPILISINQRNVCSSKKIPKPRELLRVNCPRYDALKRLRHETESENSRPRLLPRSLRIQRRLILRVF